MTHELVVTAVVRGTAEYPQPPGASRDPGRQHSSAENSFTDSWLLEQ